MAKAKKKTTKKKATKKKAVKKTTKKKSVKKKVAKKKAVKKKAAKKTTKKKATKKTTAKKPTTKKKPAAKSASSGKVSVGKAVPEFQVLTNGSKTFKLSDYKGKKLVLFFYPKDMTPGCTIEGRDFTALKSKFNKLNTEVFGISRESVKSHEKFIAKENYTIDLLSDPDETVCDIFGVMKDKSMYGRTYRGIDRSTFVIDENGKLLNEWRGVKVPGHAQAVLDYIKNN